jgi:hypothetical protein
LYIHRKSYWTQTNGHVLFLFKSHLKDQTTLWMSMINIFISWKHNNWASIDVTSLHIANEQDTYHRHSSWPHSRLCPTRSTCDWLIELHENLVDLFDFGLFQLSITTKINCSLNSLVILSANMYIELLVEITLICAFGRYSILKSFISHVRRTRSKWFLGKLNEKQNNNNNNERSKICFCLSVERQRDRS